MVQPVWQSRTVLPNYNRIRALGKPWGATLGILSSRSSSSAPAPSTVRRDVGLSLLINLFHLVLINLFDFSILINLKDLYHSIICDSRSFEYHLSAQCSMEKQGQADMDRVLASGGSFSPHQPLRFFDPYRPLRFCDPHQPLGLPRPLCDICSIVPLDLFSLQLRCT